MTRIAILGGGPAGVGAAFKLREQEKADVVLFEREPRFGGNAGSFERNGHICDFGSHRLHPACDPAVLEEIKGLLGDDLLDRPRHGRIRLLGKWVHFPLKPLDLLLHIDKRFAVGTAGDLAKKILPGGAGDGDTFASVLQANLGKTICEHFYFPYARKIWGHAPEELSAIQAKRRVAAGSITKILRKILGQVPGLKKPGAGRFYYPRNGFGSISDTYAAAAREAGADLRLETTVRSMHRAGNQWLVEFADAEGDLSTESFDAVWSTIPLTVLARLLDEDLAPEVKEASKAISYRAMILVYLDVEVDCFTEYDAHYFPGEDLTMTRMSEPKRYAQRTTPGGRTLLCAEVPCDVGDDTWNASDEELGERIQRDLEQSDLPLPCPPLEVWTARQAQAYPVYKTGYEQPFGVLDEWASALPGFLSYGRQGLFAHDNTHHALFMAHAAVECLDNGVLDESKWNAYREVFATHVVED